MKMFLKVILAMTLGMTLLQAETINQGKARGGIDVAIMSDKPLSVGENHLKIELKQSGKSLEDAKVKIKIFMPEMPGMPYMEAVNEASNAGNGIYEGSVDLMMRGTWQVRIYIDAPQGKKYQYKSSLIF